LAEKNEFLLVTSTSSCLVCYKEKYNFHWSSQSVWITEELYICWKTVVSTRKDPYPSAVLLCW